MGWGIRALQAYNQGFPGALPHPDPAKLLRALQLPKWQCRWATSVMLTDDGFSLPFQHACAFYLQRLFVCHGCYIA